MRVFIVVILLALSGLSLGEKKYQIKISKEFAKEIVTLLKDPRKADAGITAVLNDYADKVFTNVQSFFVHDALDPYEMPDIHEGFNYTLIITYHGELDMTNGWLTDLSTIHRGGDVEVIYDANGSKILQVIVPIAFNDLEFVYDYSAKIMDLGPTGSVEGKISDVTVEVILSFDFNTYEASLDEFYITNSGSIDLEFSGNVLVDWLLNLLLEVATAALKEVILLILEAVIRNPLNDLVDQINQLLANVLNPTPPPEVFQYLLQ